MTFSLNKIDNALLRIRGYYYCLVEILENWNFTQSFRKLNILGTFSPFFEIGQGLLKLAKEKGGRAWGKYVRFSIKMTLSSFK